MGCRELIGSLRAAGDEKMRALRADAEQEAKQARSDAELRIDGLRRSREREQQAEALKQADALLAAARAEARRTLLQAEQALAARLAAAARALLPSLRTAGYAGVFESFVRDLPRLDWRTVRVNPKDVELARSHFTDAEILPDERISGGFAVQTEGARVQVVNTFDKRLARHWEDMLPEIMAEARESCR